VNIVTKLNKSLIFGFNFCFLSLRNEEKKMSGRGRGDDCHFKECQRHGGWYKTVNFLQAPIQRNDFHYLKQHLPFPPNVNHNLLDFAQTWEMIDFLMNEADADCTTRSNFVKSEMKLSLSTIANISTSASDLDIAIIKGNKWAMDTIIANGKPISLMSAHATDFIVQDYLVKQLGALYIMKLSNHLPMQLSELIFSFVKNWQHIKDHFRHRKNQGCVLL
jgi:hypothetical protein